MKTIGLIGGMSWESTVPYYRIINQTVKARLGGLHSARIVMVSVDFHGIEAMQRAGDWDAAGAEMARAAQTLERAGADFIVLCTNTMHIVAHAIETAVKVPLLHIADPTVSAIRIAGLTKVGLLATRFTMEEPFYRGRLEQEGLAVLVPEEADRTLLHRIIYEELCVGTINASSRQKFLEVIARLVGRGAQGIVLGCTEISLLVRQEDTPVPLLDTTALHALAAALESLTQ